MVGIRPAESRGQGAPRSIMGAPGPASGDVPRWFRPWACTYVRITDTQVEESELIEAYRDYRRRVERQAVVLEKDEERLVVPCSSKSRYFRRGKDSIRRNIRKTVPMEPVHGVAVCLTEDPKQRSRSEAWRTHNRDVSRVIKTLREQYRRRGLKFPEYVKVIEEQTAKTGYPHTHLFFPGVRWLVHKSRLERLWGRGYTRIEHKTSSAGWYVWKYVGKVEGWTERGQAYLWRYRLRMYHVGQRLRAKLPPGEPGWVFVGLERAHPTEAPEAFIERLKRMYSRRGPPAEGGEVSGAD